MKLLLRLFVGVFFLAAPAMAHADVATDSIDEGTTAQSSSVDSDVLDHSQWRFLGCVHDQQSEHECEHLAHSSGYHHHFAQHDHGRCWQPDHNYACFGKN